MNYEKLKEKINKAVDFGAETGARILELSAGYAIGEFPIEKNHLNLIDSVHGGAIFTFADMVGGAAADAYGNYVTTVNASINYLNPAIGTKKLIGKAKKVKNGKSIIVVNVEITDDKEILIATATFTFYNLKMNITFEDD